VNVASSGTAISIGGSYAFATPAITADIALTGATGGNIVKSNNSGSVKLTGALDLGGVNRTFSLKDTSGDSYPEMTLTGVISNGSVTLNNATAQGGDNSAFGTLLFSGSNTYSGGTTLTMGRLEIANSSALGTDSVSIGANGMLSLGGGGGSFYGGAQNIVGGDLTVANNITINHTGSLGNFGIDALDNTYGNNTLSGTITLAGANTQVDINGGQLTISGAMSGTGALTKAGSSILRLTGSNSYTGGTTVNNGTLNVSSDAALGGTAGPVTIVGGATLQTAATFDFVPTRDIVLSSGTGTLDTQGNNNTVNGRLSGAGTLVKSGNGTLTLTGSNSYSGGTTVNGGTLNVVSDAALGAVTGSVTMNNGATLQTSDSFGFHASRDFVASSGTATIDTQGNTNTVNGGLSGAGTLAKSGSGTLILSGSVGIAGLDVNSGSVQLTRSVSIGALNVASGATFSMAANSDGNRNVLNVSALTIASFSSSLSVAPRASSSAATGSVLHADSLGADILTAAGQSQSGGDVAAGAAIEPASPEAVPEPGALGLLLAGALSIFGLRRKGNRLG